jgi:hypothetical protein
VPRLRAQDEETLELAAAGRVELGLRQPEMPVQCGWLAQLAERWGLIPEVRSSSLLPVTCGRVCRFCSRRSTGVLQVRYLETARSQGP